MNNLLNISRPRYRLTQDYMALVKPQLVHTRKPHFRFIAGKSIEKRKEVTSVKILKDLYNTDNLVRKIPNGSNDLNEMDDNMHRNISIPNGQINITLKFENLNSIVLKFKNAFSNNVIKIEVGKSSASSNRSKQCILRGVPFGYSMEDIKNEIELLNPIRLRKLPTPLIKNPDRLNYITQPVILWVLTEEAYKYCLKNGINFNSKIEKAKPFYSRRKSKVTSHLVSLNDKDDIGTEVSRLLKNINITWRGRK